MADSVLDFKQKLLRSGEIVTKKEHKSIDVSIVIPVKKLENSLLDECLKSLVRLNFSGSIEIIVVERGNRAQARNEGIRISRGDMVAFLDSDCIAPKDWLESLFKHLKSGIDADIGGVGGPNTGPPGTGIFSEAINEVYGSYLGSLGSPSLYRPKKITSVKSLACINSIFSREALLKAGGFDEKFESNEDTNLSARVRFVGYKLYYAPDPVVFSP